MTPDLKALTERGENACLTLTAYCLPLAGDPDSLPDELRDALEYLDCNNTEIIESLKTCALPTLTQFMDGVEAEDTDEAVEEMFCALLRAGGWLLNGSIPETKRAGGGVTVLRGITHSCMFWGATFEAALEHAVLWAEKHYGNSNL